MDRPGSVSPAYDCRIKVGFKWAFKVAYGEDNGQDCGSSSPLWSSWFSAEIRSIRVARRGHRWWWWWWRPRVLYLGFKGPDQGLAFTPIVPRNLNLGMWTYSARRCVIFIILTITTSWSDLTFPHCIFLQRRVQCIPFSWCHLSPD
jgi:hypothetical protein